MSVFQQQQQQDKLKQLGNTLVQKQEYEQAAKFYDRALELDSTSESSAAIFSNRSLCFLNMKKYKDALQDAEKVISLRSTWHRGYQRAAAACEKLEKYEEGLKHLEKCFELDEAIRSDSVLKKLKETFEINIIKQKAPSMTQDELKQIGNTFVKNQQYESAIFIYTLAIEKDAFCDAAVPILSNRSMAYFKIGKYKEAYEDGGFCCGIKPDWAKGFMRRGVAAEKLENWQIALESYDEYLKLDPSNEADVKRNREYVKKMYDQELEKEEDLRVEIDTMDSFLTAIPEYEMKAVPLINLYLTGCAKMSIPHIKLARKHGLPRLDTPYIDNTAPPVATDLLPKNIKNARTRLAENPEDETIEPLMKGCWIEFSNDAKMRKFSAPQQSAFLDYVLDVAEEEDYIQLYGDTYKFGVNMHSAFWLRYLCHNSKETPIRKDLILILMNRIKIAKRIFCGKSTSDGDFAALVLAFIVSVTLEDKDVSGVATDACTQDVYECIQTCLKAGARLRKASYRLSFLNPAIHKYRSVRVTELLLRHGADPNEQIIFHGNEAVQELPALCKAFFVGRLDIARVLISGGARLSEVPTPQGYLSAVGKHPLVSNKMCPDLMQLFQLDSSLEDVEHVVNEEFIQLLFECLSDQKLSFLAFIGLDGPAQPKNILLPMLALQSEFKLVEIMLRIRPALATLLSQENQHFESPIAQTLALVVHDAKNPNARLLPLGHVQALVQIFVKAGFNWKKDLAVKVLEGTGQVRNVTIKTVITQFEAENPRLGPVLDDVREILGVK